MQQNDACRGKENANDEEETRTGEKEKANG
jgi:hypothetical protein